MRNRVKTPLQSITEELKKKSKKSPSAIQLTKGEEMLLERVRSKTREHNLNNVTRTKAYLDFYLHHSEIQWAFLGHMVSRNGGWNMTDLKGEFLTRLMTKKDRNLFFHFLERGNWLIFQDVYPQFLLYEESIRQRKPLFHLFTALNISTFMETIWQQFWQNQDTYIHTIAMVINEQSYLENRVVQNPQYQKEVINKFEFMLQDWLSFNHILFPYGKNQLSGQTLHQFESLHERILLGKRLYTILFKNKEIHQQVLEWAKSTPHTGSRKDYWPNIFNNVNEGMPGFPYQLRLKTCQLRKGARKIYSPTLENAWKNVSQDVAEKGDWFEDWQVVDYLTEDDEMIDGEIKYEYCKTLERLELATLAKKAITF
ncbi:DUF2515 family protein [Neobacillus sp. MM2021_6]|uniref:DUF2515 family protein n=1 Tax=Bacillaceae TaxID=186817 RepID=UPI00140739EE|nr:MULTISPECIES: DUF2515 family protein [Bacillaceae]MBO0962033.1 DUF2515 family protein [Neobacillus sp. MM2021_6]NHC19940.1 DUF2515 family protein [Bacillus sp. MM2020_4]